MQLLKDFIYIFSWLPLRDGFLTGLSSNLFCAGTCAPFLLPFMLSNRDKHSAAAVMFLSGRFIAYILFGLLAGYMGLIAVRVDPRIFSGAMLLLSLWLILYAVGAFKDTWPNIKLCSFMSKYFQGKNLPFFTGFALGINLCPPFLIGLDDTIAMHSITASVVFFFGFYFGSSLWLGLFKFGKKFYGRAQVVAVGRLTAIFVGMYYAITSAVALFSR